MKTSLTLFSLGFVGALTCLAQVTNLGLAPAGNSSVLYWPAAANLNYILQSTTNLAVPIWVNVTNAVPLTAVVVTNTAPASFFRLVLNTTGDGMTFIPAGLFTMGNSIGDSDILDANPTNVYVSACYMDTNLVSYSQWQSVDAYATSHGYAFDNAGASKATNYPVQGVSWYDSVKWCNARSQQAGLSPVYFTDTNLTQIYTNGDTDTVYPNWSATGYRLPTEAEWEKAARGGLSGLRFPWGNLISEALANYTGDTNDFSYDLGPNGYNPYFHSGSGPYISPVGYFAPNGYGLYDMAGNVEEWCWDWYGTPYTGGVDPQGAASGATRVLRGGYWNETADAARCANRRYYVPVTNYHYIGFRCVRRQ